MKRMYKNMGYKLSALLPACSNFACLCLLLQLNSSLPRHAATTFLTVQIPFPCRHQHRAQALFIRTITNTGPRPSLSEQADSRPLRLSALHQHSPDCNTIPHFMGGTQHTKICCTTFFGGGGGGYFHAQLSLFLLKKRARFAQYIGCFVSLKSIQV